MQRGPIKGLDAAAQMRYNRSFVCIPQPFLNHNTKHHTKRGKIARANKKVPRKWLESPTRPLVRVVVLLSLSVYLAVNPVYSETAFEVVWPSKIRKSQSLRRTSARLLVDTVLTRRLGIYKIFTLCKVNHASEKEDSKEVFSVTRDFAW